MPTPKLRKKSRRVQSRSKPKSKSRSRLKSRRVRPRSQKKPRVKTRSKRIRGGVTKKTGALTLGLGTLGVLGTGVALSRGHRQQTREPTPEDDEYNLISLISEIQIALQSKPKSLIKNIRELEHALLSQKLNLFFTECAKNPGVKQLCNKVKTSPLCNNYLSERLKRVFYDENVNYLLSEITTKVNGNTEAQETLKALLQSVENTLFAPSDFYRSLYTGLQLQLLEYPRFLDALEVPYNDVKVKQFLNNLHSLIPKS